MTGLSLPAIVTFAVEVIDQISTDASILTRCRAAVINVVFAGGSVPTVSTDTLILTDFIYTGSSVQTGGALTVIYILMAVGSSESLLAFTAELSTGMTTTLPVRPAHTGRDQAYPGWCAVGCHCYCAAVNHFAGRCAAVVLQA